MTGLVPAEIVRLTGMADDTIAIDRVELRDGPKLRSIARILKLTRKVRSLAFDLIIDLHSLRETNILAWLSGAKHLLLADRGNRSFHSLGNYVPPPPAEDRTLALSVTYMRVLGPLGIDEKPHPVLIDIPAEEKQSVRDRIDDDENRRLAGFFPGAGHPDRCWPLERFAELARRTASDGLRPVVFLGPEERDLRERVEAVFEAGTVILDDLSIREFLAAVSELDVFVTNDTGPMHIAALGGSPIVVVMHREAPLTYLPLASKLEVVNPAAIGDIPVDDVYAGIRALIKRP